MTHFDDFLQGYCEAMLWANTMQWETEDGEPREVEPAWWQSPEPVWALAAFDGSAQEEIVADCEDFLSSNLRDVVLYARQLSYASAGHDFALTRNHHGAGFWDRGLGDLGERLTRAAHAYGASDGALYGDAVQVVLH